MAASTDREQYYPFAFSARAYVQCNGELLYVRPCAAGLYWNQDAKVCDREETAPARPANDQITVDSEQPQPQPQVQQPTFTRPIASLVDQSVDKSQGYRYRNYKPATITNDQGTSYGSPSSSLNQVLNRQQSPVFNAFYTPASMMNNQRRIQTNTYSNQGQLPKVIDQSWSSPYSQPSNIDQQQQQQTGQLNNQQLPNPLVQQQQQPQTLTRVFQPESSRSFNIKSTSSTYRRR
jgi:hypothetical protein